MQKLLIKIVFSLNMALVYYYFFFQVHLACPKGNSGTLPSPQRTAARAAPPLPSGAADQRVAWSQRHVHFSFSQIPGTQLLSLPQCIKYTPQSGTPPFLMHREWQCRKAWILHYAKLPKLKRYLCYEHMDALQRELPAAFDAMFCCAHALQGMKLGFSILNVLFAHTNHLHDLHLFLGGSVHTSDQYMHIISQ